MENTFNLNAGQAEAAGSLTAFISNKKAKQKNGRRFFTLTGDPGTGKTYMIKSILPELETPIICAAISHAAKLELMRAIDDSSINCITVAKLLGMTPKIDKETGDMEFSTDKRAVPEIINAKTVILDEVSMISDELAKVILDFVEELGIDLICIGDKHQLAPVKQMDDSLFLGRPDAELTETMRFDERIGSITSLYKQQIQNIHNDIRPDVRCLDKATKRKDNYDPATDTGYKFTSNVAEMLDEVVERIKECPDDVHNCRVLVYKNITVKQINDYVRKKVYDSPAQFHSGEILICNGGFNAYDHKIKQHVPVLHNGELVRVQTAADVVVDDIPCMSLDFIGKDTEGLLIPVVKNTPVANAMYQQRLQTLANNAKRDWKQWEDYWNFKNKFAVFDYGTACNTYKAQGASINHVYVAEGEIMGVHKAPMKNKLQAMYVACSRAKKSLTIYKK